MGSWDTVKIEHPFLSPWKASEKHRHTSRELQPARREEVQGYSGCTAPERGSQGGSCVSFLKVLSNSLNVVFSSTAAEQRGPAVKYVSSSGASLAPLSPSHLLQVITGHWAGGSPAMLQPPTWATHVIASLSVHPIPLLPHPLSARPSRLSAPALQMVHRYQSQSPPYIVNTQCLSLSAFHFPG